MKVLKFGGTSLGSASRIKELKNIISSEDKLIVVLSAMSGTTNTLEKYVFIYIMATNKQLEQ